MATERGEFVLTSGRTSDWFIDAASSKSSSIS